MSPKVIFCWRVVSIMESFTRGRSSGNTAIPLTDMMTEDINQPDRAWYTFFEEIRRDALDFIPEFNKLCLSFGGLRSFEAGKFIHCRAADLAVKRLPLGVSHREFKRHSFSVVAY